MIGAISLFFKLKRFSFLKNEIPHVLVEGPIGKYQESEREEMGEPSRRTKKRGRNRMKREKWPVLVNKGKKKGREKREMEEKADFGIRENKKRT